MVAVCYYGIADSDSLDPRHAQRRERIMKLGFTARANAGGTKIEGLTLPIGATSAETLKLIPRLGKTEADVCRHSVHDLVVPAQDMLRRQKVWPATTKAAQKLLDAWLAETRARSKADRKDAILSGDSTAEVKLATLIAEGLL